RLFTVHHLPVTPQGALGGVGTEVELAQRVGEDDGPLVTSLADKVPLPRALALQLDELAPHDGTVGDGPGRGSHLSGADQTADILAVEDDPSGRHFQSQ